MRSILRRADRRQNEEEKWMGKQFAVRIFFRITKKNPKHKKQTCSPEEEAKNHSRFLQRAMQ
jgi:hypothetical protein